MHRQTNVPGPGVAARLRQSSAFAAKVSAAFARAGENAEALEALRDPEVREAFLKALSGNLSVVAGDVSQVIGHKAAKALFDRVTQAVTAKLDAHKG